ncbi:MBL fold metallo-hydrolase [Halonatronum saccharophilum]|uniref:MBL fold metallo-hydrolase n=1 Tax=Halonatronum saccharophilum TaxID=150060 RepID=UPI000482F4F1|nr:MBL fold metallo-hydrolase [Halonatronum saccharophilum]
MIDIKALASSSKGNCYWVSDGKTPLLLECGISFKDIKRGIGFRTSEIAGCLISHEHGDHSKAIKDVARAGIDCYMSQGTAEALGLESHRIKLVSSRVQFKLGTWTILPLEVQHDALEPLGYLLVNQEGEKLLFATDTYYIKYKFEGLTYIMVECNYAKDILDENVRAGKVPAAHRNRLLESHFELNNVKKFLKVNDLSKVKEIHLLHLSDGNSDEGRFKREIQELTGKMVFIAGERRI